jgi:hypothetical protein
MLVNLGLAVLAFSVMGGAGWGLLQLAKLESEKVPGVVRRDLETARAPDAAPAIPVVEVDNLSPSLRDLRDKRVILEGWAEILDAGGQTGLFFVSRGRHVGAAQITRQQASAVRSAFLATSRGDRLQVRVEVQVKGRDGDGYVELDFVRIAKP